MAGRGDPVAHAGGDPGRFGSKLRLQFVLLRDETQQDRPCGEQQVADFRHADRIDDLAAVATLHDQAGPAQDGQLLGEVARLDLDPVKQLVDGVVALAQQLQDADPCRVAERAEELGLGLVERNGHAWASIESRKCVVSHMNESSCTTRVCSGPM